MLRLLLIALLIFLVVRFTQRYLSASKPPPVQDRPRPVPTQPQPRTPGVDYSEARDADFREIPPRQIADDRRAGNAE
ncbi:MAG: hypothetical protein IPM61_04850 [Chlorobi bacterium]|nr:MAG: hypothetical protein UZ07_CHB004000174 [Chlorobi bacterium OLB7]MBK8910639.1 hypothetical protein [Chlorobiota bacterium]MBX7216212.1 hypothetical protein [Candidatus Kapabacteria bacterium]MCE7933740.1 hypothetical protein [Chlorobi bacterium CHB2]